MQPEQTTSPKKSTANTHMLGGIWYLVVPDRVVSIWLGHEYLVRFWVFNSVVNIWLCGEYLGVLWVFGCVVSIWLGCGYLTVLWVFGCVVSICSACLVKLMTMFTTFACVLSICTCFLKLQYIELSGPPYKSLAKQILSQHSRSIMPVKRNPYICNKT